MLAIHNLICFNSSDVESVPCEILKKEKKKKEFKVDQFHQFKNINKFHTDWTVCDKAIREAKQLS